MINEEEQVCEECGLKECRGSLGYECQYIDSEEEQGVFEE